MTEREQEIQVSLYADKMLRQALDIKDNNELIAEFMGDGKEYEVDINTKTLKSYNTSWDWLMPVVIKCFEVDEQTNDDLNFKLNDALLETNIDSLYKVAVEFIKEYNNQKHGTV